MSKAIVLSLEGKRAIVLAQGGRFVRVPRETHYQIGDEIEYEAEEVRSLPRTASRRRTRWVAGAGSAAVLCLLLFGGLWLRTPPVVAYVTMDVNPSVEFGVDGKDRVQKLRAVNQDAVSIIDGISYKGKSLEDVTDQVVDKLAALHLLDGEDSEIVLTTVPVGKVDEDWENEVSSMMKQTIEEAGASSDNQETVDSETAAPVVTTVSVPKEVREEANAKGVSAGKMAFWLKAESQGHRVPIKKLQEESMKSISSDWGGVHSVLEENEQKDKDQSDAEWKALVAKAKEKDKKLEEARKKWESSNSGKKDKPSEKPNSSGKTNASEKSNSSSKDNKSGAGSSNGGSSGKGSASTPASSGSNGNTEKASDSANGSNGTAGSGSSGHPTSSWGSGWDSEEDDNQKNGTNNNKNNSNLNDNKNSKDDNDSDSSSDGWSRENQKDQDNDKEDRNSQYSQDKQNRNDNSSKGSKSDKENNGSKERQESRNDDDRN